jgi:hypothetical protein
VQADDDNASAEQLMQRDAATAASNGGDRAWLLPLLVEHAPRASHVSLALFADVVAPLAARIDARMTQLANTEARAVAMRRRVLEQRHAQLWALLPAMCGAAPRASDAAVMFKRIAKALGGVIENNNEVRACVELLLLLLIVDRWSLKHSYASLLQPHWRR